MFDALQIYEILRSVTVVVWWVDLGWKPGDQQATPSFPFPTGQGRQDKMENNS